MDLVGLVCNCYLRAALRQTHDNENFRKESRQKWKEQLICGHEDEQEEERFSSESGTKTGSFAIDQVKGSPEKK